MVRYVHNAGAMTAFRRVPRCFLIALALLAFAGAGPARALDWPTRPVRVVCGFAAGGSVDIVARLMSQFLTERLHQPFLVENRPGAGTNIATEAVVKSPPDGYTLLIVMASNAINATLYPKLNFNFARDIIPVASISREPNVMVIHPSLPARSLAAFVAYAKANPGRITMASGGNGAPSHVSGELFKLMTGIDMIHVPYRGAGPALADLLGGQVQLYFAPMASTLGYVQTGQLRALAVTTTSRSALLPDVPAVSEFVPGYEATQWYGVGLPRDTPPEIVDKLSAEINAVLADPKFRARLDELGNTIFTETPASFARFIADETEKWGKVVKFSGARPD
jgi:tripartite-type tricarboxylate transporter receptor subunit TctC